MGLTSCPDCQKTFSRRDAMLRHRQASHPPPPPPPPTPPPPPPPPPVMQVKQVRDEDPFYFTIPSNVVFVGPSGCGKTMFMYHILQKGLIKPAPNNIVWCYNEWQPLYDTIRETMPQVQFVKGIPYNLQDDNYFDARNNNVLILDDHMTEAKDDKRISQLFTRTSHHKNIINFLLLQNLFPRGKESRDIALNSHFVTLFNSPVDRQQVNLFARRIYPNTTNRFMSVYEAAVQRPYGNLTIDLRPSTSESERLKPNVLHTSDNVSYQAIKEPSIQESHQLNSHSPPVNIKHKTLDDVTEIPEIGNTFNYSDTEDIDTDMPSCDECGILFENSHDLQRHVRTWCPENGGQPLRKRARYEEDRDEDKNYLAQKGEGSLADKRDQDLIIEWQDVGLQRVWDRVSDKNLEYITVRRKKYLQKGKTQEWIEKKQRQFMEKEFTDALVNAIEYSKYLMKAPLFQSILYSLNKIDPNTDQMVIKNKIKLLLKPIIKDAVSRVDISDAEDIISDQDEQSDEDTDTE